MNKNITKINVDVILQGDDAQFFDYLCEVNKKEGNFIDIQDFIRFLFMAGFNFIKGHFIGSIAADTINKVSPISNICASHIDDNEIMFDKIFFNGEPTEFKLSLDKQVILFRNINNKKKNSWQSIYLLNQNKPLQWKGNKA